LERESDLLKAAHYWSLQHLAETTKLPVPWLRAWFKQRGISFARRDNGSLIICGRHEHGRQRAAHSAANKFIE
jgi:hypothetical protein